MPLEYRVNKFTASINRGNHGHGAAERETMCRPRNDDPKHLWFNQPYAHVPRWINPQ